MVRLFVVDGLEVVKAGSPFSLTSLVVLLASPSPRRLFISSPLSCIISELANDKSKDTHFNLLTSIFSFLKAVSCSSQDSMCAWIALLETARLHIKDSISILSAYGNE